MAEIKNNSFHALLKAVNRDKNNRALQDYLCSMVLPIWSFYESDLVYTSFKSVEEALPNFMPIFDAKEIKYFLKCLSEFKNDRHNQSACCNYKVEYIKNSNI